MTSTNILQDVTDPVFDQAILNFQRIQKLNMTGIGIDLFFYYRTGTRGHLFKLAGDLY